MCRDGVQLRALRKLAGDIARPLSLTYDVHQPSLKLWIHPLKSYKLVDVSFV